jgi:uncharacterized protein YqeY
MLIEQMKKDFMEARKAKNHTLSAFMSTLVSEVEMIGKEVGNPEITDEKTIKIVKKFINNAKDTISHGEKAGKDVSASKAEIEVLNKYLPKQMSEAELKPVIAEIVATLPEKNAKATGKVMAELKTRFGGLYDGKLASQLVKEALA